MLDEGLHAGLEYLGIRSRTVVYAEREAFPVSVLAARMEEGSLAPAPIWFGDFTELPARRFRGMVDGVVAGFPCQDLSVAGRRAGLDGKRSGLFFNVLDIADDSGAWFLVLENVAGIASATASVVDEEEGELEERAASRVMGELADRGWNAEWITLSASDVGASHGRARWFCFAWRELDEPERGRRERAALHLRPARQNEATAVVGGARGSEHMDDSARHGRDGLDGQAGRGRGVCEAGDSVDDAASDGRIARRAESSGQQGRSDVAEHGGAMADSENAYGRGELQQSGARGGRGRFTGSSAPMADSNGIGRRAKSHGQQQPAGPDRRNSEMGGHEREIFAPGPTDAAWPGILARFPWLAPAITDEAAQSLLRGAADGLASGLDFSYRAARLRAGGNGVVPLCAATAVVVLVRRSGIF